MDQLIDEQKIFAYLEHRGIAVRFPKQLIAELRGPARRCAGTTDFHNQIASRLGLLDLPAIGPGRTDKILREDRKAKIEDRKARARLREALEANIARLWHLGADAKSDEFEHLVSWDGNQRFFGSRESTELRSYINAFEQASRNRLIEQILTPRKMRSNEKYSRSRFVIETCAVWIGFLKQPFALTTGTCDRQGEALGPMADFIMLVCEPVLSGNDLTRNKLRDVLRRQKAEIEALARGHANIFKCLEAHYQLQEFVQKQIQIFDVPSLAFEEVNAEILRQERIRSQAIKMYRLEDPLQDFATSAELAARQFHYAP